MIKKIILTSVTLSFVLGLAVSGVDAQARETAAGYTVEKDLEQLRRDIRAEMKKIVAMNLVLNETEATKFWPVYDQYVAERAKNNDEFYGIIKEYAAVQKTITDAQAIDMVKRWSAVQGKQLQTRDKYISAFEKVIPGKKAAYFLQIDRRLWTLLDLQVASEIPLVTQ
jgi:hypothetical protein